MNPDDSNARSIFLDSYTDEVCSTNVLLSTEPFTQISHLNSLLEHTCDFTKAAADVACLFQKVETPL
jgi:hypothetical protein